MNYVNNKLLLISVSSKLSVNGVYFYNSIFDKLKINATYLGVIKEDLKGFQESFKFLGIHAASIAAPFKTKILPLMDSVTEEVKLTGSINSVRSFNGELRGHNTDYLGASELLTQCWKPGENPIVEIYGSGGVIPSIVAAVRNNRPNAKIVLSSRNVEAAKILCNKYELEWKDSTKFFYTDLWINATPVSNVDAENLSIKCKNVGAVFDLNGNQSVSLFEKIICERGQQFIRGFDFYRAQFKNQFSFYFDQELDLADFDNCAESRLSKF